MTGLILQSDAARMPLADRSVDLVMESSPYCDARTYGINARRKPVAWIDWMLPIVAEGLRISRGAVLLVAASKHDGKRNYWPACEGLMYRWWSEGWTERGPGSRDGGSMYRPCI